MVIKNGLVFGQDCRFRAADLVIAEDKIQYVAPPGSVSGKREIDARGGYVLPGLVDIHTHGCVMADFCDEDPSGIPGMLAYYASEGVTSLLATTMSFQEPRLAAVIAGVLPFVGREGLGAVVRGINMEGPFISPEKRGAQNPENILPPDIAMFDRLYALAQGGIAIVNVAPETPGGLPFIRHASRRCIVSIAHTTADYEQGCAAYQAGATNLTHLFNAQSPFLQREPGIIGAASDFARFVEINADGHNVHPAAIRAAFAWFGAERMCIISDSMRGTGMPDGLYDLGGQMVQTQNGRASLVGDGAIAGSISSLANSCRVTIGCGVPLEAVVRAATLNPARAAGLDGEVGSFAPGKRADVLIWNRDYQPQRILCGGREIAGDERG